MTAIEGVRREDRQESVPAGLEQLVQRVATLPALREKYRGMLGSAMPALADVPVLTKDEMRMALDDLVERARDAEFGAYVYGSGGTTSAPKLSLIPSDMFVPDIVRRWRPLDPGDVLVNMNTPGRLWSSHNFFNALAHDLGAVTVPLGSVERDELNDWLDFCERVKVTAMDGTPTHIAHMLEFCADTGRRPPEFRKLLWTGEPYSERATQLVAQLLPDADVYGIYGSTETWVIGHNGPDCPTDTFHVLPYQHIELDDGVVLVTNTHPRCLNPVLRYRVGDRGEFVACPCGDGTALHLTGRDDPQMKFVSVLVTPREIADVALDDPEVRDAQIVVYRHGTPTEHMQVRVVATPGCPAEALRERLRARILTRVYRLGWAVGSAPESFDVQVVEALAVNPRTYKTPLLVQET
ncbi:phenylacetate--CoA ligase family protein [Mangrovihabitans endophyticus]|uniref:AMP-dependent synthetase/ligase domain-containing protein n=1 Tax=Mangrovihabitans endophyticus TaxID=1751298 RepID=A0A8J3BW19_9ACTN|nr:AMP-binding protein [Mangrovihabitans endophyticus]GGK73822.1 hypothetical protein GCM10012284_04680 [Mangrovihabitans endophyticus]